MTIINVRLSWVFSSPFDKLRVTICDEEYIADDNYVYTRHVTSIPYIILYKH